MIKALYESYRAMKMRCYCKSARGYDKYKQDGISLREKCKQLNLNYTTIRDRIKKYNWNIEKALYTLIRPKNIKEVN